MMALLQQGHDDHYRTTWRDATAMGPCWAHCEASQSRALMPMPTPAAMPMVRPPISMLTCHWCAQRARDSDCRLTIWWHWFSIRLPERIQHQHFPVVERVERLPRAFVGPVLPIGAMHAGISVGNLLSTLQTRAGETALLVVNKLLRTYLLRQCNRTCATGRHGCSRRAAGWGMRIPPPHSTCTGVQNLACLKCICASVSPVESSPH